jgi:hypothetical protein
VRHSVIAILGRSRMSRRVFWAAFEVEVGRITDCVRLATNRKCSSSVLIWDKCYGTGLQNWWTPKGLAQQAHDGSSRITKPAWSWRGQPALSKMRECAEWMLGLAGEEQKKGEEADCRLVKEYLDSAARILREVAQYEAPKLTAVRVGGDSENALPIDIKTLSDAQLYALIDRLTPMSETQNRDGH